MNERPRRRGLLPIRLAVVGAAVAIALAPSAALAADVVIIDVGSSGSDVVGQPREISATLSGTDCDGAVVTFSFVGGAESKDIAAIAQGDGTCYAVAGVKIPSPPTCQDGRGDVVPVAELRVAAPGGAAVQGEPVSVACPLTPPTQTGSDTSSPPPPTPTPSSTTSAPSSQPAPDPSTTSPGVTPSPPATSPPPPDPTGSTTVGRQAALLVPVDDGGPQPPESGGGSTLGQQLTALFVLVIGAAAVAIVLLRGGRRGVVGGVAAATLIAASVPLVLPAVIAAPTPPSSAVRIRTISVEQTVAAGTTATAAAHCPAGSIVVGGGMRSSEAGPTRGLVGTSIPTGDGWSVTGTASSAPFTVTAVALCTTDSGLGTDLATSTPAQLEERDTARTQAVCAEGSPLAMGWSGVGAPAVAQLPLRSGGTSIAWGTQDGASSATDVLCTTDGSTAWPVRHESDQVEVAAGSAGRATVGCGAGGGAVGGGFVAAASVGGRVAPVTVTLAAPDGVDFTVEVVAAGTSSSVLLTAYVLCLPTH